MLHNLLRKLDGSHRAFVGPFVQVFRGNMIAGAVLEFGGHMRVGCLGVEFSRTGVQVL